MSTQTAALPPTCSEKTEEHEKELKVSTWLQTSTDLNLAKTHRRCQSIDAIRIAVEAVRIIRAASFHGRHPGFSGCNSCSNVCKIDTGLCIFQERIKKKKHRHWVPYSHEHKINYQQGILKLLTTLLYLHVQIISYQLDFMQDL